MSRAGRVRASAVAAARAFFRRRTAVFFTFFFPAVLVVIFGALVGTTPAGGGLFTEPPAYYLPGYLAVVVLFTPMSRVASEVARHRAGNRFERLATTPLSRAEWLAAQTLVVVGVVAVAAAGVFGLVLVLTGADARPAPSLVAFVVAGTVLFSGVGAVLGRVADSQDGAIAFSNGIGLPLLFLSETFVPPALLPPWFGPLLSLSPLSYFTRGARAATLGEAGAAANLAVLSALALAAFLAGAYAIPRTD